MTQSHTRGRRPERAGVVGAWGALGEGASVRLMPMLARGVTMKYWLRVSAFVC